MDLRTLTKLALKLAGLYILVSAVAAIPGIINLPKPYNVESAIVLVIYCFVGLALMWLPGSIVNNVIRIPAAELEGAVTARKLLQVGCILLGVYFAVSAVYGVVYTYVKTRWFYDAFKPFPNSRGPDIPPDDFAYLIAGAVQFVVGVLLWIGSRYVLKAVGRFEDDR